MERLIHGRREKWIPWKIHANNLHQKNGQQNQNTQHCTQGGVKGPPPSYYKKLNEPVPRDIRSECGCGNN